MSNKPYSTNADPNANNADLEGSITDTQLTRVVGGSVKQSEPTAVELPAGESRPVTLGVAQGLNLKKPGGFLPLP